MIEQLYNLCQKDLTNWCCTMTHDRNLLEDPVQEAFLRALINAELLKHLVNERSKSILNRLPLVNNVDTTLEIEGVDFSFTIDKSTQSLQKSQCKVS